MNQDEAQTKSGYGKRLLWQWVIIYVIVGGAVSGAVYLVLGHKSGNAYGKASTVVPAAAQPQGAAPAASMAPSTTGGQAAAPTPMQASQTGGW